MKKLLPLFFLLIFGASCHHVQHTAASKDDVQAKGSGDQDGSSFDNAVVIYEKTEGKGVDAEYDWLKTHYPGYTVNRQSLVTHDGKPYDVLSITTADGEKKDVYFDISNFFGKF
ncbi:MAG TPA: hypothetical protein VFU15_14855 [Bacteroidia bacterium]|nr:hypothetical protein [Bacteroidia bacterium]